MSASELTEEARATVDKNNDDDISRQATDIVQEQTEDDQQRRKRGAESPQINPMSSNSDTSSDEDIFGPPPVRFAPRIRRSTPPNVAAAPPPPSRSHNQESPAATPTSQNILFPAVKKAISPDILKVNSPSVASPRISPWIKNTLYFGKPPPRLPPMPWAFCEGEPRMMPDSQSNGPDFFDPRNFRHSYYDQRTTERWNADWEGLKRVSIEMEHKARILELEQRAGKWEQMYHEMHKKLIKSLEDNQELRREIAAKGEIMAWLRDHFNNSSAREMAHVETTRVLNWQVSELQKKLNEAGSWRIRYF